jgi:hypothetical protein
MLTPLLFASRRPSCQPKGRRLIHNVALAITMLRSFTLYNNDFQTFMELPQNCHDRLGNGNSGTPTPPLNRGLGKHMHVSAGGVNGKMQEATIYFHAGSLA